MTVSLPDYRMMFQSNSFIALYVDVLHTDASLNQNSMFSLGTRQLMGDVDFFPNNGDHQPGCNIEPFEQLLQGRGLIQSIRHMMTCDHRRSVDLLTKYLEEKNSKNCMPLAYRCKSWDEYENGNCYKCGPGGQDCAIVGEPKLNVRKEHEDTNTRYAYYIKTTANSPLCAYQYRVEFNLSQPVTDAALRVGVTEADSQGFVDLGSTKVRNWEKGKRYAFVFVSEEKLRNIDGFSMRSFDPATRSSAGALIHHAIITPMNEWSDKHRSSIRFCDFSNFATRRDNSC